MPAESLDEPCDAGIGYGGRRQAISRGEVAAQGLGYEDIGELGEDGRRAGSGGTGFFSQEGKQRLEPAHRAGAGIHGQHRWQELGELLWQRRIQLKAAAQQPGPAAIPAVSQPAGSVDRVFGQDRIQRPYR